ncbi:hypothetical protein AUEXF2481DRAFT_34435 [Aureobasidium subglaciale EXF-2481]|uniref:DUF4385 domain-containing protein n=1 Tax=Aureobasidium subglaciale (strain EXF-2481) TaxID=1043005 RepID=A0A074YRC3_AURSE|nr:uncharacterized protein AUEXF2481DRAFT_34435 [Aureobasidium subglaciale EXF-2481]KAI5212197.1 hypothetical protein E4T38_00740 [Aureobasidium subglaciale]KAI5231197.1 hypothetical protein E4T40_00741 [Aureobasidium subglaciale]KAI5234041.1 hypothetical protein E4T41_00739 [Aureobasidium subglaciale]KAI5267573.1 hypothetical protein E4T46_00739 [Aureobasidium subglaciale]KER00236.1 hypothetical protein AUEXF2481DRAFT_34435 [Aureobasidium subglaciale EXF-2481]
MPRRAPIATAKLEAPTVSRPQTTHTQRMEYRIGRGEMGVLTFEPYKSYLLPLWRFRTPDIARQSSTLLRDEFEHFGQEDDFVGMDMTRKFIQMGFTRSKRYANHKGGRKYDKDHEVLPNSKDHADKEEKEESSRIFKDVLEEIKQDETYLRLKEQFQKELKEYKKQS